MVINHLNVHWIYDASHSVLSWQTEFERTRRRLSARVAPAGVALVLEALAWIAREAWSTGGNFRHGQFPVVRRSSGAWVGQAQLLRTRRMASFSAEARVASLFVHKLRSRNAFFFIVTCGTLLSVDNGFIEETELHRTSSDATVRTETIVASVGALERSTRFTLLSGLGHLPSRSGVHKAEFSRASGNTGLRTEAVVASIGMLEVGSRLTGFRAGYFAFRLGRWLFEGTELHRAACDAVIRAEAIVASIGTLERTSRYAFVLRWLLLLGDVPFRFGRWFFEEAELHRASSEAGRTADTVVASIGTLERCTWGTLGGCWLHSIC